MLLSLTNPQNIAYWAAMGGAMGAVGVSHPTAWHYGVFFAGFMAASVVWCFVCAALVDKLFRRAGAQWARFTYRLCAVALLALALGSLRDLFQPAAPTMATPPAAGVHQP
jgi:chemosensory pili system protein ChpE/L-lysine exporter family protein LysE/ArgO